MSHIVNKAKESSASTFSKIAFFGIDALDGYKPGKDGAAILGIIFSVPFLPLTLPVAILASAASFPISLVKNYAIMKFNAQQEQFTMTVDEIPAYEEIMSPNKASVLSQVRQDIGVSAALLGRSQQTYGQYTLRVTKTPSSNITVDLSSELEAMRRSRAG